MKTKEKGQQILLCSAILICLLFVSMIGIVKNTFASTRLQCYQGTDCESAYTNGNGVVIGYFEGVCQGPSYALCMCVDWIGAARDSYDCAIT